MLTRCSADVIPLYWVMSSDHSKICISEFWSLQNPYFVSMLINNRFYNMGKIGNRSEKNDHWSEGSSNRSVP